MAATVVRSMETHRRIMAMAVPTIRTIGIRVHFPAIVCSTSWWAPLNSLQSWSNATLDRCDRPDPVPSSSGSVFREQPGKIVKQIDFTKARRPRAC
ncbi:uncharacterized protein VTP21DRAFT_2807 [Calcarisporiella thermophila]|uniref:uncharacterized protein n=1 Tax=Calcarisporiella thermophila TaxID=911321 RepID=UPI0037430E4D